MKARGALIALVWAAAFLSAPAAATAGPEYEIHPGGMEVRISLGEKHDYFFSLSADDRRRVKLVAEEGFSAADYSVEGRVSSSRIEADLGSLGKVDVKIHLRPPSSVPFPAGEACSGRPTIFFRGRYHGTIRFTGERDIPAVGSRHGRVTFIHRFRRICKKPDLPSSPGGKGRSAIEFGILSVGGHEGGRTTNFQAFDLAQRGHPGSLLGFVFAAVYERLGPVLVARSTFNLAAGSELLMSALNRLPETLRVEPEEPFSGRAILSRTRRSPPTWDGDLSVRLPGGGRELLTGPGFSAGLCRASTPARIGVCFDESESRSRPLSQLRMTFFQRFLTRAGPR